MSEKLPGGRNVYYGLFHNDNQIGFKCVSNYTPHKRNTKKIYHANRLVIHPDYSGIGLGLWFSEETNELFIKNNPNTRVMAKFSSIPLFKILMKSKRWVFKGENRLMGKMRVGGSMDRGQREKAGFREGGVRTFHFEYVGGSND